MRVLIFGSTGTIGRQLVAQALDLGHEVTAFARNGTTLQQLKRPKLSVFIGDVLDIESVKHAVKEQDAVLCALGAGRKEKVRSEGTFNIIKAMEGEGIKKFICQTTLGAGESRGNLNFFWKNIMFGWFLKDAFLDHELQEQHIRKSQLDWTIVRPAAFANGGITTKYRHGFPADEKKLKLKISRADVAHFMLKQLDSERYLRKTPALSY